MSALPVFNPATPCLSEIRGGFRPSLMVRIKGRIRSHGRCQIDFIGTSTFNEGIDVPFHISIRPNDKVIVRNHFQSGRWGVEERYGLCRVKKEETFEIVLLAEMEHYKIAVNGHHLGVFRHRIPLHMVQFVRVSGEVSIDHILLEQDQASAHEQTILSQINAIPAYPTPAYPSAPTYPILQVHQPTPPHHHAPPLPPHYTPHMPPHHGPPMPHHQGSPGPHYQPPGPPHHGQHPHSSVTRIGNLVIERRPGTVIVKQSKHSSHVYRF